MTTHTIQLISSDLNGTLVHEHTMMDMLRVCFPNEPHRFEETQDVFSRQTAGKMTMAEAFALAGPLTKGLSLRKAIDYAQAGLHFFPGFETLLTTLHKQQKHFVINSTGYTVTTEVIKLRFGAAHFFRVICNQLVFGWEGERQRSLTNGELLRFIKEYMAGIANDSRYDEILATGDVLLGIRDEAKKASELFRIAELLNLPRSAIAHVGDTMGDSAAIAEVAKNGGLGIAFNYNDPLRDHLERALKTENIPGRIEFVDPKGSDADLKHVLDLLLQDHG